MKTSVEVKPNESKRTFTIRKYTDGKLTTKYRTYPMSNHDFDSNLNNTENDWKQFLKSDEYYKV